MLKKKDCFFLLFESPQANFIVKKFIVKKSIKYGVVI